MKTSPRCISCFFRQAATTCSLLRVSQRKRQKALELITQKLLAFDFSLPPVVFGKTIYNTVSRVSGMRDIFLRQKLDVERYLLSRARSIEDTIQASGDPLYVSAKMCTGANAIDFGAGHHPDISRILKRIRRERLKVNHFPLFKQKLSKAKAVLIIGDNCGEAVFDRFFIVRMRAYNPRIKVFYATRSAPIINDILIADAKRIGLDSVADILSSGCAYPGLFLSKASVHFKKVYSRADFVISKGQGNFESLQDKRKHIFYLFKIKCPSVADELSLPVNSLLFLHNKSLKK